jgi:hypothetical protein
MINIYLDVGVKNAKLFHQIMEESSLDINIFYNLTEMQTEQVDAKIQLVTANF